MIMKVVFYYYYLFYQKFLDPDPKLAATLALTVIQAWLINVVFGLFLAGFFCFDFNKYYMIGVLAITFVANTFYFCTSENVNRVLRKKPKFFNNHKLTVVFVLLVSLAIISTLFWAGDYINDILDRCR